MATYRWSPTKTTSSNSGQDRYRYRGYSENNKPVQYRQPARYQAPQKSTPAAPPYNGWQALGSDLSRIGQGIGRVLTGQINTPQQRYRHYQNAAPQTPQSVLRYEPYAYRDISINPLNNGRGPAAQAALTFDPQAQYRTPLYQANPGYTQPRQTQSYQGGSPQYQNWRNGGANPYNAPKQPGYVEDTEMRYFYNPNQYVKPGPANAPQNYTWESYAYQPGQTTGWNYDRPNTGGGGGYGGYGGYGYGGYGGGGGGGYSQAAPEWWTTMINWRT